MTRKRVVKRLVLVFMLGALLFVSLLLKSLESRSDLLHIGSAAPDFSALTGDGEVVRLSEVNGRKRVVLVFYPGDGTPVCTTQLCSFRDQWTALEAENAVVYGVNPADRSSHSSFAKANHFPFPLIVDSDGSIARKYGCSAILGIVKRTVYVIDRRGRVAWVKRGNPPPSEILQAMHDFKDGPDP